MESPLARWLKLVNMSQGDLAIVSGCHQSEISRINRGQRPLLEPLRGFLAEVAPDLPTEIDEYREQRAQELKNRLVAA